MKKIGFEIARDHFSGRLAVHGPKELVEELRTEVVVRIDLVRAWLSAPKLTVRKLGECEICLQTMPGHKAGSCLLCDCALQKVSDETKSSRNTEPT